ncbi:MAG TPA: hypothetical protein VFF68_02245, partial [Anaerolineaceae bacterium]|nr:hypothetical protein [Anaerolineaceae bacterium]
PRLIERYWETAVRVGFHPGAEMQTFLQEKAAAGFPAGHHSPEFSRLYRPAYRVVWKDGLESGAGFLIGWRT